MQSKNKKLKNFLKYLLVVFPEPVSPITITTFEFSKVYMNSFAKIKINYENLKII